MSTSPCCHDCTDFTDDPADDKGCCSPAPTRRTCEAPTLPVPECDAEPATIVYDPETEEFTAESTLYDSECSPLLDSNDSPLTALAA